MNTIATDLTPDEAMQSLHALEDLLGPAEVRNFAGVLVSVPFQAQRKDIQAAVNYLLAQIAVRDQVDCGGT
jgi:hypothetical protein